MLDFNVPSHAIQSLTVDALLGQSKSPADVKATQEAAILEHAESGRAFSLQEVHAAHPEVSLSRLFEVARRLTTAKAIQRVAQGIFIAAGRPPPSGDELEAIKAKAKIVELLSDPLLQHLDTPRLSGELCRLLSMTNGAISLRADRLGKHGLVFRRVIGKRLYFARTEAELDRLEEEDAVGPDAGLWRIMELLPEDGLVEKRTLFEKKDIGPVTGARHLCMLQEKGLVDICTFNQTRYVHLTDAGKAHFSRKRPAIRMPATDWSRENYANRLGILMLLDLMQPLCTSEVRAASRLLPPPFCGEADGKHVSAMINHMRRDKFLEWSDADQDPADVYATMVIAPKAKALVEKLRRFAPYPDQDLRDEMSSVVAEKRRKRQARRSHLHLRTTEHQYAVLRTFLDSGQGCLPEDQIELRVRESIGSVSIRRALASLCERTMIEKIADTGTDEPRLWRITDMGREAGQFRRKS